MNENKINTCTLQISLTMTQHGTLAEIPLPVFTGIKSGEEIFT